MAEEPLKSLSDMASEATPAFRRRTSTSIPWWRCVGAAMGIPADVMTIDCLRTRRRITLILHDGQPGVFLYQFVTIDDEVGNDFQQKPMSEMSTQLLFDWMEDYFG